MKAIQLFLKSKSYLVVLLLSILVSASFGQSHFEEKRNDYAEVILKCMSAEQIQALLQLDEGGNPMPIVIKYWHPIIHPVDLEINFQGNNIHFTTMSTLSSDDVEAYFLIREFQITDASSFVRMNYIYFASGAQSEWVAEINLSKIEQTWEIIELNLSSTN